MFIAIETTIEFLLLGSSERFFGFIPFFEQLKSLHQKIVDGFVPTALEFLLDELLVFGGERDVHGFDRPWLIVSLF